MNLLIDFLMQTLRQIRTKLGFRSAGTKLKPLIVQNQTGKQFNISVVFSAHNAMLLKTMTMSGRGVAWIPASLIQQELDTKELVLAGGVQWQIPIDIKLYRQKAQMSQPAESVWKMLTEVSTATTRP